jgi:general secretion pathway protein J
MSKRSQRRRGRSRIGERGFSLIEALLALALTGLVLSALAAITAQWLPNWNRGFDRIQFTEMIGISMQRIAADLSAAEFVPAGTEKKKPLFEGTARSVTFVRTALGPNTGVGLDVVRIGETNDRGRLLTVRSRTPFAPISSGISSSAQTHVADPVVLLRPPLGMSFAYAGPDRVFRDDWHDRDQLPTLIMVTVRDTVSRRVLSVSTVTSVHVNAAASSGKSDGDGPDDAAKPDGRTATTASRQDNP